MGTGGVDEVETGGADEVGTGGADEVETGGVDEVETGGTNEEVQILSSSSKSEFVRIFFLLKSLKEYSFLSFRKIDEGVAH